MTATGLGKESDWNMKMKRLSVSFQALLILTVLTVSCSKEQGSGLKEGDIIRFSVQSTDLETRTVYGERTSTKQPILWTTGDQLHIVMYNPSDYSGDHQYAVYQVKAGGNKTAEIEPVGDPLTWKSTQTKVVAYYLPNAVATFLPDYSGSGAKGLIQSRFFYEQKWNVTTWPDAYGQHTSPVQDMKHCPMFVSPTTVPSSGVVTLSFQPLFTAFEITLKNTFKYARYVYGVRIWNADGDPVVGDYVIRDITQPLSGGIENLINFPPKYFAGMDFSYRVDADDESGIGQPNNAYLARVNGWGEGSDADDYGTFTFTIFCCPLSFSNMKIQVCGGEGFWLDDSFWANPYPRFMTEYPLTNDGSYIQFAAQKKHVIEIILPDHYNVSP